MEKDCGPLSVLVIVATLNEEEGVGPTLTELRDTLADPMFLVVDGNSSYTITETADVETEVFFQYAPRGNLGISECVGR